MLYAQPDQKGLFGQFGGRFVPESLMKAVQELEEAYEEATQDDGFQEKLHSYLKDYVGRENPLYYAENLSKQVGGADRKSVV